MKKENKLNCAQAKSISIISFLHKNSIIPTRQNEKEAWYKSPIRNEKDASFKVSKTINCWYDHGSGDGGNIIDLVIKMNHNCSVKEALSVLSGLTSFSFHQQNSFSNKKTTRSLSINKIVSIKHPALINYYSSRGISKSIISQYASEIHYSNNGKDYFAIGLKNRSGGWELRNKYFKGSTSPKDYTHISNSNNSLIVTEGMFDFFSIITIRPALTQNNDFVILNSLAFTDRLIGLLPDYSSVKLFLDNDEAGNKATQKLCNAQNNCQDMSHIYIAYIDINSWINK